MIPEEQQDQAAFYALGLLEASEASDFEAAMQSSAELRELVRELRDAAATVALSSEMKTLPAALKETVMRRVGSGIEPVTPPLTASVVREQPTWIPWAIAAGLAAASIILFLGRAQMSKALNDLSGRVAALTTERDRALATAAESRRQSEVVQAQVIKLTEERETLTKKITQLEERSDASRVEAAKLTADRSALQDRISALERNANVVVATLNSKLGNAPQALATIIWDGAKQQGVLRTADVPETTTEQDYQLWIADAKYKAPVDAGVFSVGKSGRTEMVFRPRLPITAATQFLVSLERKGGVSSPAGPIVLAGKL